MERYDKNLLKNPIFLGGVIGHWTGEGLVQGYLLKEQFLNFFDYLKTNLIESNFPPRMIPPHTEPYSIMLRDFITDPQYALTWAGTGILSELPFQLPTIILGGYLGYRLSKTPLLDRKSVV